MKQEDLRELFREFDRQAGLEARNIALIRKQARGILKPEVIERSVSREQGIVLAYGMGEVQFSPEELKSFLEAINKYKFKPKKGHEKDKGVPRAALIRASRPIDIQRSKQVRNATLYQRQADTLFFKVTGNSQAFYRVQIRLEEWNGYVANTVPVLEAAQKMVRGKLSIECPCGRHQYWYRYMATLGNYAIAPLERGFPKIRNRELYGCCCKHVLKVLHDLASNRIVFLLAKELERERNKSGFSGTKRKYVLGAEDLRLAQAKRMTQKAMQTFRQYEKEAAELKKNIKPKPKPKPRQQTPKKIINELKILLPVARAAKGIENQMLNGFAKTHNMSRAEVDAIIKENNL